MSIEENMDANESVESSPMEQNEGGLEVSQESEGQPEVSQERDNVPFHEHPRFKELIENRSQLQSTVEELKAEKERFEQEFLSMREQLEQFQKLQAGPSKEEQFVSKLQKIDPELAAFVQQSLQSQQKLGQVEQMLQQRVQEERMRQAESIRETANKQIETLHQENKVPKELQSFYRSEIQRLAQENPGLSLNELPNLYRQVHENMNKFLDSYRREERQKYVADKSKDARIPAATKGGNPAAASKGMKIPEGVDPREAMRAAITKAALSQMRGEGDL